MITLGVFYRRIFSPCYSWYLRRRGCRIGEGVIFYGYPDIRFQRGESIELGDRVVITSISAYTAMGVTNPVLLHALTPDAKIAIGRDSGLSGVKVCSATLVQIGSECLIGSGATISDTDFHPSNPRMRRFQPVTAAKSKPVYIEDNVFIGYNALILKGVSIGRDSIVQAGCVIRKSVGDNVVAFGTGTVPINA